MNIIRKFNRLLLILLLATAAGCGDNYPIDEDGLLITDRAECYVSNLYLQGVDFQTVLTKTAEVDTVTCTIHAEVFFGTDLKNIYPKFSLVTDAKLEPKITGLTDFSDLSKPRQWTVVSGNRKVRKLYTVYITVKQP